MSSAVVDQQARDMALAAQKSIDVHEAGCAARWTQTAEAFGRMEKTLDKIHDGRWKVASTCIVGLLGISSGLIGYIFVNSLS